MLRNGLVCAILLIAACGHKTPDQQLHEAADAAASWSATLQMTAETWLANSVPRLFVLATVDAANKAFDQTGKDVAQSQGRQELRAAIKGQLDIAEAAAGDLKKAIENNDRNAVAGCARRFAAVHSVLQQLEDKRK